MESPRPASPRTPWLELALLVLGSRALVALIGWLSPLIVAKGKFQIGEPDFLGGFTRWDATWFLAIADRGYSYTEGVMTTVAFFPLYPLLVHLGGWLPGGTVAAGFLLSNLALFGAAVLLWQLLERDAAEGDAALAPGDGSRAVRLLLFGPVSFFFSIIYSEATFLFLVLACLCAARRRHWLVAGLAGLGAALTRNAGLLLAAPLLIEYYDLRLRAPYFQRGRPVLRSALCLLPLAGIVIWGLFLLWRFGDALLFLKAQAAWGRKLNWPWVPFGRYYLRNFPVFHQWWFVGHAAVAAGLLGLGFWARLRPSYLALATLMLLLNLSANHLESIPRLVCVIFPLYAGGAWALRRWPAAEIPVLGLSAGLLALSTTLFVNGYWFT